MKERKTTANNEKKFANRDNLVCSLLTEGYKSFDEHTHTQYSEHINDYTILLFTDTPTL